MLRRKLLIVFGSLIVLMTILAVTAIWMLNDVIDRLDHVHAKALALVDQVTQLNQTITSTQVNLYELQLGKQRHLDNLIDDVETAEALLDTLDKHYMLHEEANEPHLISLQEAFEQFKPVVGLLATTQDPALAMQHNLTSNRLAAHMQGENRWIVREARKHAYAEQRELDSRFRWLVLGIAIGYVLLINVSIIILLRAASMVLRPVDQLVKASRQLVDEQFDYRAELDRNDEFAELAKGYNALAERLQTNERRKLEMLGHVALTLNHELNNAVATIEMQVELLNRRMGKNEHFESGQRHIRENLQRIVQTIESLKHVRRIVLTDYVSGTQMLDLEQSVLEDTAAELPADKDQ